MERRKQQTTKGRALCLIKANKELNFPRVKGEQNRKCEQWKTELAGHTDSNFLLFFFFFHFRYTNNSPQRKSKSNRSKFLVIPYGFFNEIWHQISHKT